MYFKCILNVLVKALVTVKLTLFGTGVPKMPTPLLVFFFKYLENEKMYDFAFLWLILNVSAKFFAKILIGSRVIVILSEGYRKNSKQFCFQFFQFIFLKQAFLQNVLSIHYVEVVNMIFLLVFKYKYIRIGNFVVFLSESMELTSDRFFYLLCKTICFYLFIFFFL